MTSRLAVMLKPFINSSQPVSHQWLALSTQQGCLNNILQKIFFSNLMKEREILLGFFSPSSVFANKILVAPSNK